MSERKTWATREDDILRQLYENRGIKKWSTISTLMAQNYHIEGRSGKQCRERYHNHLKRGIKKEKWSAEQEEKLVELHSIHGNKWALISKLISGRTQNCVKNMFNSKLRKSVRWLNRFIYLHYRKILKEIKNSFVNRLSEFTETAHKKGEDERNQEEKMAIHLKNEILRQGDYEIHQMTEEEKMKVRSLVEQIHNFKKENHKNYRGNVLARLRKQKMRCRKSQEHIKLQEMEEQNNTNRQIKCLQISEGDRKISIKPQNNKKQANLVQEKDYIQLIKEESELQRPQVSTREPVASVPFKRGLSVRRPDSLESNYSGIFNDQRLEKPIQVDNYMHNITPTPRCYQTDFLDWSLSVIDWRFNAD